MNLDCLEDKLNEKLPEIGEWEVEINDKDKYDFEVILKLPPFVPAINEETGELWYVCTRENVDLAYVVKDNGYVFYSDDKELLDLLFGEVMDNGGN